MVSPARSQSISRHKILYVEYPGGSSQLVSRHLNDDCFSVLETTDAESALRLTGPEHLSLLILGPSIAHQTGLELARQINACPRRGRTPVIQLYSQNRCAPDDDANGSPETSRRHIDVRLRENVDADTLNAVASALIRTADAEKRLRQAHENEARLLLAIESTGLGTFDFYPQTGELLWSDYAKQHFGLSPDSAVDYDVFLRGLHPDDRNRVNGLVQNALRSASGGTYSSEYRTIGLEDGELRWVSAAGRAFFDEDGRAVRFIGITLDITAHKLADEARRASETRERARAAELEAIMEAAPVAIFLSRDLECLQLTGNRMAHRLLGLAPGQNCSLVSPDTALNFTLVRNGREIPPDDLPIRRAALTGKPVRNVEFDVVSDNGEQHTLLGDALPVVNESGAPAGAIGAFIDITERKRAEERLRQAQKLESIGLLAGGIAHDFNNLLTGILGNASLVLEQAPPSQAERVQAIVASAERAGDLTRQLLAYSGKGQFVSRELDISNMLHEMGDLVQFSIPKSVELSLNIQKRLPSVRMDPSQLQQVLMNLVINAGEAVGEGNHGHITLATSLKDFEEDFIDAAGEEVKAGRYVCIEITDTGAGISENLKTRIFDPFFTTKFTGRGLGLAAVAGILRSQNGGIVVESAPDRGSTFRIFLPSLSAAGDTLAQPNESARPTVLIVDDEAIVRDFLATALSRHGYAVLTASDGHEALAVCERNDGKLDAMILDIVMPRMGARELLPPVKALRPDLKILLTSGYTESEARRLCDNFPGTAFIQKPYSASQLVRAVELLVGPGSRSKDETISGFA